MIQEETLAFKCKIFVNLLSIKLTKV